MADIFGSVIAPPLVPSAPGDAAAAVRFNIDATAAKLLQPYASQGSVTLTVKQLLPGNVAVLALPSGQTITAQTPRTPLTPGTQLVVQLPNNGAALASAITTAGQGSAGPAVNLTAQVAIQARVVVPPAALPATPAGANAPASTPLTLTNLENALRQSPLLSLPEDVHPQAAAATLPAGPVVLTPADATLQGGPAVLQVNGLPTQPGQPQQATLFPIPAANAPPPAPVQVLINAGQTLPVGTELSFTLPPPTNANVSQPVVVQLAAPVALAPLPVTATQPILLSVAAGATITVPTPTTPPNPNSITLNLPANAQPVTAPLTARVLTPATPLPAPQPGQPQLFSQQVVLSNGQNATLTTPTPLPPGTAIQLTPNPALPTQPQAQSVALPQALPADTNPFAAAPANTAATTTPVLPNLPLNQTLMATVTGNTPATTITPRTVQLTVTNPTTGEPVNNGVPLTVATPVALPTGTTLQVKLNAAGQFVVESLEPPTDLTNQQTLGQFENQWPQLAKAAAQLGQSNPAAAQQLGERLPQAGSLLPGLANYMNALQHQGADKWLGDNVVTMLRSMGIDLAPDLSQLSVLRQPTTGNQPGWQGVLFPYVETPQSQPQQGRFFWKNTPPEDEEKSSGNTRFLVEMNLSKMGEVQLDGLLTSSSEGEPEIWLKLRVHPPTDTSFGRDLQQTITTMLQNFGLGGGISIESATNFPIDAARLIPAPTTPTMSANF